MKETKLVCDIMSTIACHILNNPYKEQTMEHLIELFHDSPLQKVDLDLVMEHMDCIKSAFSK